MLQRFLPLLYSLMGAILLSLAWYVHAIFIFIGFIPVFLLEEYFCAENIKKKDLKFTLYSYLLLVSWNLATTWWIALASGAGAAFAIIVNSLLMLIPISLFRLTKRHISAAYGYFSFILYWLSFEYFHLRWELSWTWLHLGNVFAFVPSWVQWYAYTGVLGGTLWVLSVNLLGLQAFKSHTQHNRLLFSGYALGVILLGIGFSALVYFSWEEPTPTTEVVIVQPNIEPYEEIFIETKQPIAGNPQYLITLAEKSLTPKTELLIFPEVTLSNLYPEATIKTYPEVQALLALGQKYPKLLTIIGLTSYVVYPDSLPKPANSRFQTGIGHYEIFNSALIINEAQAIDFYHKSMLVPGIERFPYASILSFLAPLVEQLGGSFNSLGVQEKQEVFSDLEKRKFTALICYESIFGEYVSNFVKNGASVLCIITNDGWWGNTAGHIQHFHYARLRAIETRRWVIRAANTGISGVISPQGKIMAQTTFWKTASLKAKVNPHGSFTFYVLYGDYIGRLAWFLAVSLFLTGVVRRRTGLKRFIKK